MSTNSDLASEPTKHVSELDTQYTTENENCSLIGGLGVQQVEELIDALELMEEDQLSGTRSMSLGYSIDTHLIQPLKLARFNALLDKTHVPWDIIRGIFTAAKTAKANGKFIFPSETAKRVLYSQRIPQDSPLWHGCQQFMSLMAGDYKQTQGDFDVSLTPQDRDMPHFGLCASNGSCQNCKHGGCF